MAFSIGSPASQLRHSENGITHPPSFPGTPLRIPLPAATALDCV